MAPEPTSSAERSWFLVGSADMGSELPMSLFTQELIDYSAVIYVAAPLLLGFGSGEGGGNVHGEVACGL